MLRIIATIGAIQAVAIAVSLIRSKVVAVLLGPEGVGVISVIDQTVQLIAQVSIFSLPFTAVKFLSRSHSRGPDAFERTYSGLLRALLLFATGGTAVSVGLLVWKPLLLGPELSRYRVFLFPALLGIPAMALHGFFSNVLAAAQQPRAAVLMALVIAVSLAASAYVGIALGGIPGFYWSNLLAVLFVAIGVLAYLRRKLDLRLFGRGHSLRAVFQENRDIVTFSLILYLGAFMYSLSYFAARYAVLARFGEAEAGLLQAALALSGAIGLVLGPANGLYLTPIMNRNIAKEEKMRAALEFQRKLMIVIGASVMPMVLFPQILIALLFSPAFVRVGSIVFLFILGQCVVQLAAVHNALIIGLDDLKAYGVISLVGHSSFAIFAWLLAPRYGLMGVAFGLIISSATVFGLTLARLSLTHGLVLSRRLRSLVAYGLLGLLVAGGLFNQQNSWHVSVVLAKVGLYFLFVIGLLLFINREEFQWVVEHGGKLIARQAPGKWRGA